jgi:hypothetical protein
MVDGEVRSTTPVRSLRAELGHLFISALNNLLKKPFLLGLFIALLLWLNRTYGVSFVRLWPLLIPDVVLRLPAEVLWKLSGLRLPRVFYESFIMLGQAGALFTVWKVFLWARAALHRPPRPTQVGQPENSHDDKSKIGARWKRNVSRVAVVLLVLLIINSRCGRGLADMVSLISGVPVYTLPVSTEVSIESPVVNTDKDPGIRRPPMLVLSTDPNNLLTLKTMVESIWRLISSPGGSSYSSDDSITIWEWAREVARVNLSPEDKVKRTGSSESSARRPHILVGGSDRAAISANLELLLERAGGGWWQERAGGFLISFGTMLSRETAFSGLQTSFPPFLLLAEDLEDACRFIEQLTNVSIVNKATKLSSSAETGIFGQKPGLLVHGGRPVSFAGMMEEIALSCSLIAEVAGDRAILKEVEGSDIAQRVNELMEKRRLTNIRAFPDSTLKLFPAHSADIIAGYLDDSNDSIIEYALAALKVVGLSPARTTLVDMMQTGQTKSGRKLNQALQRQVVEILVRCGEPSALSHLEALGGFDRMDVSILYDEQVNIEPSLTEAEIQEALIARLARYPRMVRPGKIKVKELPLSVSRAEAARVERIALDFLCAVSYLLWDEKATAKLTFTQDGKHARYSLELSHDWGPLAAGANENYAILVKVSGRWVVVKCDSGYSWFS